MKHLRTVATATLAMTLVGINPPGTDAQTRAEAEGAIAIQLTTVAELDDPIAMATRQGTTDLYVAEREGVVRRLEVAGTDVTTSPIPVVDISSVTDTIGERGLLGLTFNPLGTKLYLHYTNNAGDTRLVEYTMNATGRRAIGSSRRLVLAVDQPTPNHNGGTVDFGPDGHLYLALGDGGDSGDPNRNGQNLRVLLGKILRIDPDPTAHAAYRAPGSNPFSPPRRREIWLYGVRNPWRISFDHDTGDLYVADVGQSTAEEINVLPADGNGLNAGRGVNLGWRRMEGNDPFPGATEPANHTAPLFTYDHSGDRCAIIGGHVYRGPAIPALEGYYLYGDFCTGTLSAIQVVDGVLARTITTLGIDVPDFTLQAFGQDGPGEVYVLTANGDVARIDPA